MKHVIRTGAIAVLCLAGSAGILLSQQQRQKGNFDPAQMVDRQMTAMKERLKLTDEQEPKVKAILVDSMKKMGEIRQKYGASQQGQRPSDEAMADMKKAREEDNKKMSEVLTKDQMSDYEKMMSERRRGGPGGQGGRQKQQQQ